MIPESVKLLALMIQSVENGWPVTLKALRNLQAQVLLDVQHPPPPVQLPHPAEIDE
jgi:hypothetical protein